MATDCEFSHEQQRRRGAFDMAAHDLLTCHHILDLSATEVRRLTGGCKTPDCGTEHGEEAIAMEEVKMAIRHALDVVNEARSRGEQLHRTVHGTEEVT